MTTLNELRQYVRSQLIQEANVVGLANRQLDHVGLVQDKKGKYEYLIAVSLSGKNAPQVLGVSIAYKGTDVSYYRLIQFYSDTAVVAIVLLASSLEHWGVVVADHSVSPAAQQVMKRYFDQNKDNPGLIDPELDISVRRNSAPDYLKAAYLGPVGFDLETAFAHGDKALDLAVEKDPHITRNDALEMFIGQSLAGFDNAFADNAKTKTTFDTILVSARGRELCDELSKAITKGGSEREKAVSWLRLHADEASALVDPLNLRTWINTIQPVIDKLNYEA